MIRFFGRRRTVDLERWECCIAWHYVAFLEAEADRLETFGDADVREAFGLEAVR